MPDLPYDKYDPLAIEEYSKGLLGKSLREIFGDDITELYSGKGELGNLIEELYFHYKPNSNAEPDFKEAGVELKTRSRCRCDTA